MNYPFFQIPFLVVPLLEEILAEWEKSRGTGTSAKGGCDSALAQRAFFDTYDPEGEEGQSDHGGAGDPSPRDQRRQGDAGAHWPSLCMIAGT